MKNKFHVMRVIQGIIISACMVIFAGCSENVLGPVASNLITITVNSMNQSDIKPAGMISKDENISNETGNPWGEFIKRAESECQASPSAFEIVSVSIELDTSGSQNVNLLEEIMTGTATVYFASTRGSDEDALKVDVASKASISGSGIIRLENFASQSELQVLSERLLGGDFHVGLRAETSRTRNDAFSMDVRIIFEARAHCE